MVARPTRSRAPSRPARAQRGAAATRGAPRDGRLARPAEGRLARMAASGLTIRPFAPGDLPAVRRVREAAFGPVFRSLRGLVGEEIAAFAFLRRDRTGGPAGPHLTVWSRDLLGGLGEPAQGGAALPREAGPATDRSVQEWPPG